MSKYSHLVWAMESEGAVGTGADTDEVAAAETATEVEQNVAETNDVANNVAEVDTGIGNAGDAAEGLGEVADAVEAKVESGDGMTETEAEFAEMAVEAYCKAVGISARKARIFPSMESFGGRGSRLRASKLALEGIKDTIKRIWEAIKAGIARAIEMIKSFFNGFVKSRDSLEKHLNNLEQRINDLPSNAKRDKDSFSTSAAAFSIDGKAEVGNIATILTSSGQALERVDHAVSAVSGLVKSGYELAENQSVSAGDWGGKIQATIDGMADGLKKEFSSSESAAEKRENKDNDDLETWELGRLPHNKRIVLAYTKAKNGGTENSSDFPRNMTKPARFKLTVESSDLQGKSKDAASSIPAPENGSKMLDVVTKARGTLKVLKKTDNTFKENIKQLEEMRRHADKMTSLAGSVKSASTSDNSEKSDIDEKSRKQSTLVNDSTKTLISFASALPNTCFDAVKAAADYVAAGLANMKVEKK